MRTSLAWARALAFGLVLGALATLPTGIASAVAEGKAVQLNGQTLFQLAPSSELSAEERAALVQDRLGRWATRPDHPPVRVVQGRRGTAVMLGDETLVVVIPEDARLNDGPPEELGAKWSQAIEAAVAPKPAPSSPTGPISGWALFRRLAAVAGLLTSGAVGAWLLLWGTARLAADPRRYALRLPPALISLVGLGLALMMGAATVAAALARWGEPPSLAMLAPMIGLGALALVASAEMLGNLAGGLTILATPMFRVGDRLRMGGHAGKVSRIGLFFTRLETERFGTRLVPNATVLRRGVVLTPKPPLARLRLPVKLAYTVERNLAQALILEAALRTPGLVDEPAPEALIAALEEEHIRYELLACVHESERPGVVASRFHVNLMEVLGENHLDPSGAPLGRAARLRIGLAPADSQLSD